MPVPANQFACPTSVDTFAKFVIAAMESDEFGTFHAACTGVTSRFEFFERAFALAGQPTGNLRGTANPWQGYRIELDDMMARLTGVYEFPTWEDDLAAFAAEHGLARRWPAARRNRRGACLPRSTWAKSPNACISG